MGDEMKTIVVVGDVTIDWMFMKPAAGEAGIEFLEIWGAGIECHAAAQPGAAALLADLTKRVLVAPDAASSLRVLGPEVPPEALYSPAYDGLNQTWTSWAVRPRSSGEKRPPAWRLVDFWGQSCADGCEDMKRVYPVPLPAPAVLAIDDANLGFRKAEALWAPLLDATSLPKAIIMKMATPLAEGALWDRLVDGFADRLTVVVPINDLRKGSAQIGTALSWERTVREIASAVRSTGLDRAARVVVNLGSAGVVVIERDTVLTLVYDPHVQEGDWERQREGHVLGLATCLCAALVLYAATDGDLLAHVERSISAMRTLHANGYEIVTGAGEQAGEQGAGHGERVMGLKFPFEAVAADLRTDHPGVFARADFPQQAEKGASILVEKLGDSDLFGPARVVALTGPESLSAAIPVETVGKWTSVDRSEIESMRAVRNMMAGYVADYERGTPLERPLSIAVFGPPGAGKSFAVKQIAKVLLPGRLETVTFNLSQFRSEQELPQAFHSVRDLFLRQKLPLVFWDEFDTPLAGERLGWLRYFLAPMQDGEFREEGVFHPIGPAIFVFAGGTSSTFQEFAEVRDVEAEKAAKKPDFLSRLKGYVNVFGPNKVGPEDAAYMLRRALLLRGMLRGKAPQLFRKGALAIDEGLLRALLSIDSYKNGARSMEAILDTSALGGKLRYERSSLPPEAQLALQVDAEVFQSLLEGA